MNISRRNALSLMAVGTLAAMSPIRLQGKESGKQSIFRYCLNTSTISGKNQDLHRYIEVASKAGYNGIEVWVRDVESALNAGHSLPSIKRFSEDHGIRFENAIGFAPWMAEGEEGFIQMEKEMLMLAEIGCPRIAAPPAGIPADKPLDLFAAGEKYKNLLELGRKNGVMPQLEFWGSSPVLWHMGQVMMIAAVADDPDSRILPDVYHMYRGGSGFNTLKMVGGSMIDVFHMNDYPASKPRDEQDDADRVYPGDGVAPLKQILMDLKSMGGEKVLSLELFNKSYWEQEPLAVAMSGLAKMKSLVNDVA
jgi:sugar phosphate isomerase/epimerase